MIRRLSYLLACVVGGALLWLLARMALEKGFSLDEFQYAHAAWAIADGQLPYRDFFEVHFPLVYLLGALVFRGVGDLPEAVVLLRWVMLPFAVLSCLSVGALNRDSKFAWVLAPLFLIATLDWTAFATEFRPDSLAAALFVASLALLSGEPGKRRVLLAGVLAGLAIFSAQKAAFYVVVTFGSALVIDRIPGRRTLPHPLALAVGGLIGVATSSVWIAAPGMPEAFWKWTVLWGAEHQRHYPSGFSWTQEAQQIARNAPLLFPLAALGLVSMLWRRGERENGLLPIALVATFLSAALQTAPFRYSFVSFLPLCAIFAARGVEALAQLPRAHSAAELAENAAAREVRRPLFRLLTHSVAMLLALTFVGHGAFKLTQRLHQHNRDQLETLRTIARITGPDDVAYDNSGSFVARPHVDFYFYTDKYLRMTQAEKLVKELPEQLVNRGAVLKLRDIREEDLPAELRAFLDQHFQPYDGDLALWGQRYQRFGLSHDTFLASRAGRFFLHPAELLKDGRVSIDGVELTAPEFELTQGLHQVGYSGAQRDFFILWLPADGKRWTPRPDAPARFSRVFY